MFFTELLVMQVFFGESFSLVHCARIHVDSESRFREEN
jgi:hypothetical protein